MTAGARRIDRQRVFDEDAAKFCERMAGGSGANTPSGRADRDYWLMLANHLRTTDAAGNPLEVMPRKPRPTTRALERWQRAIEFARDGQAAEVELLRQQGMSWSQIAAAVGLTTEGARRRWAA